MSTPRLHLGGLLLRWSRLPSRSVWKGCDFDRRRILSFGVWAQLHAVWLNMFVTRLAPNLNPTDLTEIVSSWQKAYRCRRICGVGWMWLFPEKMSGYISQNGSKLAGHITWLSIHTFWHFLMQQLSLEFQAEEPKLLSAKLSKGKSQWEDRNKTVSKRIRWCV